MFADLKVIQRPSRQMGPKFQLVGQIWHWIRFLCSLQLFSKFIFLLVFRRLVNSLSSHGYKHLNVWTKVPATFSTMFNQQCLFYLFILIIFTFFKIKLFNFFFIFFVNFFKKFYEICKIVKFLHLRFRRKNT